MCQTTIINSPLAPVLGRFMLGAGATLGLFTGVRLLPDLVLWMGAGLAVTTTWAVIATVLAIRAKTDMRVRVVSRPAPPPPVRHSVRVLEARPAAPLPLPAADTATDPLTTSWAAVR